MWIRCGLANLLIRDSTSTLAPSRAAMALKVSPSRTMYVVVLVGDSTAGPRRFGYQLYLATVVGAYFMFCWLRSGQTLAMKTWGLRLVDQTGVGLSPRKAFVRYLLALAGTLCGAVGFLWALVDADRQFLHDRLMRTRIVKAPI